MSWDPIADPPISPSITAFAKSEWRDDQVAEFCTKAESIGCHVEVDRWEFSDINEHLCRQTGMEVESSWWVFAWSDDGPRPRVVDQIEYGGARLGPDVREAGVLRLVGPPSSDRGIDGDGKGGALSKWLLKAEGHDDEEALEAAKRTTEQARFESMLTELGVEWERTDDGQMWHLSCEDMTAGMQLLDEGYGLAVSVWHVLFPLDRKHKKNLDSLTSMLMRSHETSGAFFALTDGVPSGELSAILITKSPAEGLLVGGLEMMLDDFFDTLEDV